MNDDVYQNYEWFKINLKELVKEYNNKYIVIKDNHVIGSYDSYSNAYHKTILNEKIGTFIIQLCSLDEEKTCAKIYTPNILILN